MCPHLLNQRFDLRLDHLPDNFETCAVLTCLKGSDGKEDHTVAIYNNLVFDGNFAFALPFNKDLLDLCCSGDGKQCSFVLFETLYCFHLFQTYLKANNEGPPGVNKKKRKNMKKRKREKMND